MKSSSCHRHRQVWLRTKRIIQAAAKIHGPEGRREPGAKQSCPFGVLFPLTEPRVCPKWVRARAYSLGIVWTLFLPRLSSCLFHVSPEVEVEPLVMLMESLAPLDFERGLVRCEGVVAAETLALGKAGWVGELMGEELVDMGWV